MSDTLRALVKDPKDMPPPPPAAHRHSKEDEGMPILRMYFESIKVFTYVCLAASRNLFILSTLTIRETNKDHLSFSCCCFTI